MPLDILCFLLHPSKRLFAIIRVYLCTSYETSHTLAPLFTSLYLLWIQWFNTFRQRFENQVNELLGMYLDCLAWDIVGINCIRIKIFIRSTWLLVHFMWCLQGFFWQSSWLKIKFSKGKSQTQQDFYWHAEMSGSTCMGRKGERGTAAQWWVYWGRYRRPQVKLAFPLKWISSIRSWSSTFQ